MNRNTIQTLGIYLLLSLMLIACTGTKERFKGKTAKPDQIFTITSSKNADKWDTKELSVNFVYTSSTADTFNLEGTLSIADLITNSFPNIKKLNIAIHFLDPGRSVISTKNIPILYSVYNTTPDKIKFNFSSPLPVNSVAFCFSYSGEFLNDSKVRESKYIGNAPFM